MLRIFNGISLGVVVVVCGFLNFVKMGKDKKSNGVDMEI